MASIAESLPDNSSVDTDETHVLALESFNGEYSTCLR